MYVALDARRVRKQSAGVGQYVTHIVHALLDSGIRCLLFVPQDETELPFHESPHVTLVRVPGRIDVCWERYRTEQRIFAEALRAHHVDLYHATDNMGIPRNTRIPTVVTIHDLIPWVTGEYLNWWKMRLYRHAIQQTARSANHIITISEYTKKELEQYLHIMPERLQVIYNGYSIAAEADPAESRIPGIPKTYILYVGGLGPRKNIPGMLTAYSRFIQQFRDAPDMVFVGAPKPENRIEIEKTVKELALNERVHFTGFITDAQLAHVRSQALFVLYLSTYEGFGLPIIEAMSQGVPVLTSNVTAMPEVGADAALYADPHSIDDITEKMAQLFTEPLLRAELVVKGKKRAQEFSWKKTTDQIISVYEGLV